MRRNIICMISMLLVGMSVLTSCVKDEAKNKECDITSAWVQGDEYAMYFQDKNQMRKSDISSSETEIVFTVRSLLSLPKQLPLFLDVTLGQLSSLPTVQCRILLPVL